MAEAHRIDPAARPYDPAGLDTKPEVGAGGFHALDLRVGTVLEAAPFAAARDPALLLTVTFAGFVATPVKEIR